VLDPDKVFVIGHAIDQMNWMRAAGHANGAEHRKEWGETGAAGEKQLGSLDLAQIEATGGTEEFHRCPRFGALAQEATRHTARYVTHQEL
jgi:hypothetical protein